MNLSCANRDKLQRLQDTAVRLIFNMPPRTSVYHKYLELQLLRVNQCIVFKCLLFVHKFFKNEVPASIRDLLIIQDVTNRLLVAKYYPTSYASKSFSFSAPRYWNKLSITTRLTNSTETFKTLAKLELLENRNNILSATTGYYFLPLPR